MTEAKAEPVAIVDVEMPSGLRWLHPRDPLPPHGTNLYLHPPTSEWNDDKRDAERYRWLRVWYPDLWPKLRNAGVPDDIDAAVDAAIAKEGK